MFFACFSGVSYVASLKQVFLLTFAGKVINMILENAF